MPAEVKSRTQVSRPRTQKKSEAKANDQFSESRPSRGQGQECSRPGLRTQRPSVLQKKGLRAKNYNFSVKFQAKKKRSMTLAHF